MEPKEILVVDGKLPMSSAVGYILQSRGHLVLLAPDVATAAAELDNYRFDLILVCLAGYEKDKLDFLPRARRLAPQAQVLVVGNSQKRPLPQEAFLAEVDDYLLAPFTAPELCRRVDRCLHRTRFGKPEIIPPGRGDAINERVLNSLMLKFCGINNSIYSLMANIKILVREKHINFNNSNFTIFDDISKELMEMMSISEELLCNHFVCLNEQYASARELQLV